MFGLANRYTASKAGHETAASVCIKDGLSFEPPVFVIFNIAFLTYVLVNMIYGTIQTFFFFFYRIIMFSRCAFNTCVTLHVVCNIVPTWLF